MGFRVQGLRLNGEHTWNTRVSWLSIATNSARSMTTRPSAAVACVRPSVSSTARMMHFFLNGPSALPVLPVALLVCRQGGGGGIHTASTAERHGWAGVAHAATKEGHGCWMAATAGRYLISSWGRPRTAHCTHCFC